MNAIEISGLTKSYGDFVLDDISFCVPEGSILGLVGENGAGKSTTIKLIMNTISRDAGKVYVLGTDNTSPSFSEVKEDIGVVLDEAYFPEVLSAKNVDSVMKRTYRRWDEKKFSDYLSRFRLPEDKQFKEYSRGMKMKLAIAVALSHDPKLLVLDEATSGLDPMIRDEILDIFNDFTRDPGHSILLSSHIVSDLEKICDYIAFIHNGRLMLCEEKDRLLEEYAVVKMSPSELEDIPESAIVGKKVSKYAAEALVRRGEISPAFATEHCTLEDIILFLAREGRDK